MIEHEEAMDIIENNPKTSKQEKDDEKQKLVLSYGLRRYCCNSRLMSYKRIVTIVK
jgi:DNA-directed RNA polymerase subunit N (RpoN/RPB10)